MKTCNKCGGDGPFHKDASAKDGLYGICIKCKTQYNGSADRVEARKQYARENKNKIKAYKLSRKYKLSVEEYEEFLKQQENRCAICRAKFDESTKSTAPHVDHNHNTKEVRGVLCARCNVLLGMALDSPVTLIRAVVYMLGAHHPPHGVRAELRELEKILELSEWEQALLEQWCVQ